MELNGQSIIVAGGGIGGLAVAIALRDRGASVVLMEQADALKEVGAGLQISPNGFRVIEALGLGQALAELSIRARAVSLRDHLRGAELLRLDLTALPEDQGYFFVHRADLIDLLARAARARGVQVRLLQKVAEVVPGTPPMLIMANGDRMEADLIVAADGLHSVARPALNGVSAPQFTGQVAWRAIVPNLFGHPPHARVHMGPGRHIVSYPLRDGHILNLVAVEERDAWAEEGWNHPDDPVNLRAAFAGFGPDVHQMLAQVEQPMLWGLFRHPVAQSWGRDGAALLGDAAHPTLPFLAQGANMALEDAWMLGRALAVAPDRAAGLALYQRARRDRVSRVIEAANANARNYHLRGPVRQVAHLGLSLLGRFAAARMLHRFDWLYSHDVTREPMPE